MPILDTDQDTSHFCIIEIDFYPYPEDLSLYSTFYFFIFMPEIKSMMEHHPKVLLSYYLLAYDVDLFNIIVM